MFIPLLWPLGPTISFANGLVEPFHKGTWKQMEKEVCFKKRHRSKQHKNSGHHTLTLPCAIWRDNEKFNKLS